MDSPSLNNLPLGMFCVIAFLAMPVTVRPFIANSVPVKDPAVISSAAPGWDAFLAKFRAAVKSRNKVAIKAMASKTFEGYTETVSEWLRRLDEEDHWYMLENALEKGTIAYREIGTGRPARATQDHQFFFVYENHRWRFDGPSPPE